MPAGGKKLPHFRKEAFMGFTSSIHIGASGVMAQQERMSVISDNIANLNTVGFKSSNMLFNNLISKQLTGADAGNQVGQGVGVSSILPNMSPGALESTNTPTDIAVGGKGFFLVSPDNAKTTYYTRAGNFRFDADGYLRDPQGNILQGYRMPATSMLHREQILPKAGAVTLENIRLSTHGDAGIVSEPEATTEIRMALNLDSGAEDRISRTESPFTALFDSWDATRQEPLGAEKSAYSSALKIYDANGTAHAVTAYFDPVSGIAGDTAGHRVWEYLLTVPPSSDGSGLNAKKGILMAGTLTFSPSGELVNMTAFSGTSDDKANWRPVSFSSDGYPQVPVHLAGSAPTAISLDMGLRSDSGWSMSEGASMAGLGATLDSLPGMGGVQRQVLALTNFSSASSTIYQSQNGYERGLLKTVSVNSQGVLTGYFSNGQSQDLYKIPLADFVNPQGLFREGGNRFSASRDSGAATLGWAGDGRLGLVAGNSLENSNVDLATEFVNMIITQKGFDANSKAITTGDQIIQTAIQMKK